MRVLIVGAGMTGLTAARRLTVDGHEVTVVDKGRAVGGRMASKRVGEARFDIGAQHFSVRSELFRTEVDDWFERGLTEIWYQGSSLTDPARGIEPRHRGVPAMRAICEGLAAGLDVRLATRIDRLEVLDLEVRAVGETGRSDWYDAAVVTAPAPQAIQLVRTAPIDPVALEQLSSVTYAPCLVAMIETDRVTGWKDGHLVPDAGAIAWMADEHAKGVSAVPAITVHSTPAFAAEHIDRAVAEWLPLLIDEAAPHLPGGVHSAGGHGWRYAQPRNPSTDGAIVGHRRPPIVFAGEAFAGARIEGAFLSGLAAVEAMSRLSTAAQSSV